MVELKDEKWLDGLKNNDRGQMTRYLELPLEDRDKWLAREFMDFRAEWRSEAVSNFLHYMVALTITVWALGAAFLLSGKYPFQGLALMFLGFVPMCAGIFLGYRRHR